MLWFEKRGDAPTGRLASAFAQAALLAAATLASACAELGDEAAAAPCPAGEQFSAGRCAPGDALIRPRVLSAATGSLQWAGEPGQPWMLGHAVQLTVELNLQAQPLESSVAVRALSPSRQANCTVASLPVRHGAVHAAGSKLTTKQTHLLQASAVVPEACSALIGATDVVLATVFDPQRTTYLPARDDHAAGALPLAGTTQDPTVRLQSQPCKAQQAGAACKSVVFAQSNGLDVWLRDLTLATSVGVVEYAGAPLKAVQAKPAAQHMNEDGELVTGQAVAQVEPAEMAPLLTDAPLLTAALGVAVAGMGPSQAPPADVSVTLAIRPVGADTAWVAVEHHAVRGQGDQPTRSAKLAISGSELAGGAGLALQVALPDAVRDRLTTGDWQGHNLFELQVCVATEQSEQGPAADAKANNCQTRQFVAVRVRKDYGVHRQPEAGLGNALNAAGADYFELGTTTNHPIGNGLVLKAKVFRGAYRETENGHVRLGAKTWANLIFFSALETAHVVEAGAYHDAAPIAADFVSGYLTILSAYTLDLPKYTVAENFNFELNAKADVKNAKADFGGTANLGPLVDALNFVAQQASSDGLKWCFFDVACIEPPFQAPVSLTLGLSFVKNTSVPDCEVVPGVGCYRKELGQSGHFWQNAAACTGIAASLASDHGTPEGAKALRGLANKWDTPFYMGLYRPGNDYHYLMSKLFFDKGWGKYAASVPSSLPTHWAFLDVSIEPENGACAAVAPDNVAKYFEVNYNEPTVAKQLASKPWLADEAAKSHVGCEAKLPAVCEYPVDGSQVVFENSQIYVQQTGKIVVDGKASYTKQVLESGNVSLNALKATVEVSGFVMKVTWAATAGLRWNAAQNPQKQWRVKGSNFGKVAATGQMGQFDISGEGCVFLGIPAICLDLVFDTVCTPEIGHWECLKIDFSGLTKILPTDVVGISFALDFMPFDIQVK